MTDRRRFWSDASQAEIAEACRLNGLRLSDPKVERIVLPVSDLFATPGGARDRQRLRGQAFVIRAVTDDGWAFGETQDDRYTGWVDCTDLYAHPPEPPTHRVAAAQSYAKTSAGLKVPGFVTPLSIGSELVVLDETEGWSRVAWTRGYETWDYFVPSVHLIPIEGLETDPVSVAERVIGTPYLWGGNSAFGIDCSGLVTSGCLACGLPCPGDSDLQEAELGQPLPEDAPLQRGDLIFWKGHVAWVADPETLIHANAYHMAVAYEPLQDAIARINAQGDGPVTARKRLEFSK